MANPTNLKFESLCPEMKLEVLFHSGLKGACSAARLGRNWYQLGRSNTLWRMFSRCLGMEERNESEVISSERSFPLFSKVERHVLRVSNIAKALVGRVPSGKNIEKANALLQEEISIGNTVALEACLVRRWAAMPDQNSLPAPLKNLLEKEFSVKNTKEIKEWLKVRDTFIVWEALINQCSLPNPLPPLNSLETLEEAQKVCEGFSLWLRENEEDLSRLHELNLRWVHLTSIPSEIGFLSHLQKLDLACNLLSELPEEIGKISGLKTLILGSNYLTAFPHFIFGLNKIEYLDLSKNCLVEIPEQINVLRDLRHLSLTDNSLEVIPEGIGELVELRELHLGCNALSDLPDTLGNLTGLTELGLYGNRFQAQPAWINGLASLRLVSIFNNPLPVLQWSFRDGIAVR